MVNRYKGFSLIELLIAMAIMSMTILIASMGYSFFMERWQGNLGRFNFSASTAKKLMLTKHAISGAYPYIVRDEDNQAVIYFEGNQDSVVGITTKSFFTENVPSVFRFTVRQNANLTYDLLYEEALLDQAPFTSLTQAFAFTHQVTLLSGLVDIKFSYFGYASNDARVNNQPKQWWQTFNALQRKLLPEVVGISFIPYGESQEMLEFPLSQVDPRLLVLFHD